MTKLQWIPRGIAACLIGLVVCLVSPAVAARQSEVTTQRVTFSKDIAPILQRACQNCHNPHASTPMSLMTYEEVRPWAKVIKLRTSQREMPPWYIDKAIGIQKFKDDPSLSDVEIAKIAAWVDSGASQGNPADMPSPLQFTDRDQWMAQPELIVSSPVMTVNANGPDDHTDLGTVATGLTEDRYIKTVEFREVKLGESKEYRKPNIHHAVVVGGSPEEFSGDDVTIDSNHEPGYADSARFRITHEVGQNPTVYPNGVGVMLKAGSVLWFASMHTHTYGLEEKVRSEVGFTFYPKGYTPKYPQSGVFVVGGRDDLDIPAGADNVRFDAYRQLPRNAILTTFEPHMHMSGKRMCYEAIYPDGARQMLNCASYNHNWVKVYIYEEDAAPILPAGTMLHVVAWYNNSPSNRNTIETRNWKGWGMRTFDDMFSLIEKITWLTDDQYKAELAARAQRRGTVGTTASR
jgi:hypothetical protein